MNPPEPEPQRPHLWLERITWVLIYGGLLTVVYSFALGDQPIHMLWGWSVGTVGAAATVAGLVLIYIRSRFKN
jgi:hypothetical protein